MATRLPLHKVDLSAAAHEHESFAVRLLTLCDNFEDARRMLITRSRHWNRTVLHLAVQSGLRDFCAHAHCQTLCDEWFRGNLDAEVPQVVLASQEMPSLLGALRIVFAALVPITPPGFEPLTTWTTPTTDDGSRAPGGVRCSVPLLRRLGEPSLPTSYVAASVAK